MRWASTLGHVAEFIKVIVLCVLDTNIPSAIAVHYPDLLSSLVGKHIPLLVIRKPLSKSILAQIISNGDNGLIPNASLFA